MDNGLKRSIILEHYEHPINKGLINDETFDPDKYDKTVDTETGRITGLTPKAGVEGKDDMPSYTIEYNDERTVNIIKAPG